MSKSPVAYSTKKELFSRLHSGILLRQGKLWFSVGMDGVKSELISAKEFVYQNPQFLKWRSASKSRFSKVAKMYDISNLKIQIKIRTQFLSPGIMYGVYLVFRFCEPRKVFGKPMYVNLKYKMANESLNAYFAEWGDENWMMTEICQFINHNESSDLEVLLESFSKYYCGDGAIFVEGIQFRAIDNSGLEANVRNDEKSTTKYSSNAGEEQRLASDREQIIKKRHMLPAKAVLHDSSNVKCFSWKPLVQSRFVEVAELLCGYMFRIKCNIETQLLSPDTTYGCYLVYKLSERCRGLHCPVKACDLLLPKKNREDRIVYFRSPRQVNIRKFTEVPKQRDDGWTEVRVCDFITQLKIKSDYRPMDLKLISFDGNMRGLIVYGIEFRPET